MCVLIGVNQLGFGAIIPVLPLYAQSYGVSTSAIGMAVAFYGLARFFSAVPAGTLSDRIGRRPSLVIGGLISALGSFWCAMATGYPEFIAARFVSGFGAGMVLTLGHVVLTDISTPEVRGRMVAMYHGSFLFAVGIGPLPGGYLAEHYGLAAPFWAYGFASLGAVCVAWFVVKETRQLSQARAASIGGPKLAFRHQIALMIRQTGYFLVCSVALFQALARTGGLFIIVPLLGATRIGLSPFDIGLAMAMASVCGILVAYPAGVLVDKYGRKVVIVPATILTGASFLLFTYAPDFTWFIAATLVWGVASSVGGSAPAAYAGDSAPPGMNAAAMSTFRMVGDAGYVVGPIMVGMAVDITGPNPVMIGMATCLVIIALIFGKFAPETHKPAGKKA